MVKRNIFSHAVWHPDVWELTTLLVQGTFSLLTGIYSLTGLGFTGSSKPWRDCAIQGSWLDVVTSGIQVAHLGQRKNTLPLRLDLHMTSCLRCPWMNLSVFFTGNLDLQLWNWLCASEAVYEKAAFLWCLMACGCHIWGLMKVALSFTSLYHSNTSLTSPSWESEPFKVYDSFNVFCPLSLVAFWENDFYSIIVPQKDG